MKRLIKSALYSSDKAPQEKICNIEKSDPWEKAAERIKKYDPTGQKSYELWLKLMEA